MKNTQPTKWHMTLISINRYSRLKYQITAIKTLHFITYLQLETTITAQPFQNSFQCSLGNEGSNDDVSW